MNTAIGIIILVSWAVVFYKNKRPSRSTSDIGDMLISWLLFIVLCVFSICYVAVNIAMYFN